MTAEPVSADVRSGPTPQVGLDRPLRADAERNRQRILAAATQVFARRGLSAGLEEIAHCAGVGVGTIYRRFPDKDVLIEALFERRIDTMIQLARSAAAEPDSWRGLERFILGMVELHATDRALKELVFGSPRSTAGLIRAREALIPILSELVARAQADGHLRADVAVTDIPVLQLMLDSAAALGGQLRPDLWHRFLVLLLDGLRAERNSCTPLPAPPLSVAEFEAACGHPIPSGKPALVRGPSD